MQVPGRGCVVPGAGKLQPLRHGVAVTPPLAQWRSKGIEIGKERRSLVEGGALFASMRRDESADAAVYRVIFENFS